MIEHQYHILRQELPYALPPSVVDYSEIHSEDCQDRLDEDQAATVSDLVPC